MCYLIFCTLILFLATTPSIASSLFHPHITLLPRRYLASRSNLRPYACLMCLANPRELAPTFLNSPHSASLYLHYLTSSLPCLCPNLPPVTSFVCPLVLLNKSSLIYNVCLLSSPAYFFFPCTVSSFYCWYFFFLFVLCHYSLNVL